MQVLMAESAEGKCKSKVAEDTACMWTEKHFVFSTRVQL